MLGVVGAARRLCNGGSGVVQGGVVLVALTRSLLRIRLGLGMGLVWAGGPHQVSVTIRLGLVRATSVENWLGLGMGLVRATTLHQASVMGLTRFLSKKWLGLGMGLVRVGGPVSVTNWLGLGSHQVSAENLAGAWYGLVRAGGPGR